MTKNQIAYEKMESSEKSLQLLNVRNSFLKINYKNLEINPKYLQFHAKNYTLYDYRSECSYPTNPHVFNKPHASLIPANLTVGFDPPKQRTW